MEPASADKCQHEQRAADTRFDRLSNPRPSERAWKIWKQVLQSILHTNQNGKLNIVLPSIQDTNDWMWYYDDQCTRLYQRVGTGTKEFIVHQQGSRHRTRQKKFRYRGEVPNIPTGCRPATVYYSGGNFMIDGLGTVWRMGIPTPPVDGPMTIDKYIHVVTKGSLDEFVSELQLNRLIIMSDGSAKNNNGTCAWIITSELLWDNQKCIEGCMKTPAGKTDSYRAECFGIFGGLWSLTQLIQHFDGDSGLSDFLVNIGCDNVSAIERSFDRDRYPDIRGTDSDYDILRAIRAIIPQKVQIAWRHVKGHQTGESLDIWGTLNSWADKIAGQCQANTTMETPPSSLLLLNEKWQLLVNNQKIYKNIKKQLYDHMSEQIIIPYWQKKGRFFPAGSQDINWDALGAAMQQSPNQHRQWITKRASRDCGANHVLFRRKAKHTDLCPLCQHVETVTHVLQCQDSRAQQQWDSSLAELRQWLIGKDTNPSIIEALCNGLNQWRQYGHVLDDAPPDSLISAQNNIGWNGVLEGCFSRKWEDHQDQHFRAKNSLRSGFKWQVAICRRIWQIPWDMWQHRNRVEHANDQQNILLQIRTEVQDEITQGNDNDLDIDRFLQEATQTTFFDHTAAYQKGWLRGIRTLRARKRRRGLGDRAMQHMRRIMSNFISR